MIGYFLKSLPSKRTTLFQRPYNVYNVKTTDVETTLCAYWVKTRDKKNKMLFKNKFYFETNNNTLWEEISADSLIRQIRCNLAESILAVDENSYI